MRAVFWGVFAAGMLAVLLVGCTYLRNGVSPAERAATALVMPVALAWSLLFACAWANFVRGNRRIAIVFWTSWLLVGLLFNGIVAGRFLQTREYPTPTDPLTSIEGKLDGIVLLGGFAGDNRFGVPQVSGDGQRLVLAAQCWHAGKTKTVICTGTAAGGARDPSVIGRQLLTSLGVPDGVIFEVPGYNTAGEMASLRSFFDFPPPGWLQMVLENDDGAVRRERGASDLSVGSSQSAEPRIGLVTTAVHLSRAMRLAQGRQMEFVPLGCHFDGASRPFVVRDLIPSAGAGKKFAVALKEWLGSLVGR